MVPNILGEGTAQVFIPLIRFLQYNFVSIIFLVLLKYSFSIFSFIFPSLMVSSSIIPKYLYVSFSLSVLILSWFGRSIPTIRVRLSLFITSMAYFSMPNSISMSWLYILTVCVRVSNSFSFLANSLMSSGYIRWFIFSCDLVSFVQLWIFWVCEWVASLQL